MKRRELDSKCHELLLYFGLDGLDLKDASCIVFEQGEYVFCEGDPVQSLHLILSGKAKIILRSANGKQLLLSYFMSEGILGNLELMVEKAEYPLTVQAISELICVVLPLSVYAREIKGNIRFLNHMARDLAKSLYKANRNALALILQPLEARLCAYITQTAVGGTFRETLTEVAELLGTSYRHLFRVFADLCEAGILQKGISGYRIANQQVLDEKAGDLYTLR